jgi:hypothetical protein
MEEDPQVKVPESPTIQGAEPKPAATNPHDEGKELLAQLEKLGVKKPEQIQGMAVASEQAGKMANMLGDLRRQNEELKRILQENASRPRQQQQEDPYNPQPVNIEDVVERAVGKFYQQQILEPQQQAQAALARDFQEIQEDDHFSILGSQFEEYVKIPKNQYAIQTGQTSLAREYRRFKDRYFTQLLGKVTENYKSLLDSGARPPGVGAPPHMETSGSGNYVPPDSKPDTREAMRNIASKSRGSDDDIDKLLSALLPDGDPILRRK